MTKPQSRKRTRPDVVRLAFPSSCDNARCHVEVDGDARPSCAVSLTLRFCQADARALMYGEKVLYVELQTPAEAVRRNINSEDPNLV